MIYNTNTFHGFCNETWNSFASENNYTTLSEINNTRNCEHHNFLCVMNFITTSCVLWISSQFLVCYESHHNFLCVMNLITISCVLLISPREVIIFWNNCIIQNKITIPVCIKRDFFTTKSPWFINFLKWDLALMIKWYTSHNSLLIGVHLTLRFPQRTWFNEKQ